jgi:2-polyprenyl-3-methyl-5-hydroxy-6-metoxy-1,4-benzoquinol methylase
MQFDQFADDYQKILDQTLAALGEGSSYFAEYKARYFSRLLRQDFSGKVLDFGCGVGLLSGFLKQHVPGAQIHGFDISADSIRKVDRLLTDQGLFTSEFDRLAHDYDLIIVANVMHHLAPHQRQATVHELTSRLNPDGRLVILEHNPANPLTRRIVERCPFDKDAVLLAPPEARHYLLQAGLRVVRRDYVVFMPRGLSWLRPLEAWLVWLPLGAQYVIVGEKQT